MDAEWTESLSLPVLYENIESDDMKRELWVFAYGSLCWKPGFNFQKAVVGYVQGFTRKFWQGNTTHRGTQDKVIIKKNILSIDYDVSVFLFSF